MPYGGSYFGAGYFGAAYFANLPGEVQASLPYDILKIAKDTCITERVCKRSSDVDRRGWDLTWLCVRRWAAGAYFPTGTRIRPLLFSLGGQVGVTGFQYQATRGGYTGEDEPAWPRTLNAAVEDGSAEWTCEQVSDASLYRTITDIGNTTWRAEGDLAVTEANVIAANGILQISAKHLAGQPGKDSRSFALVEFSDDTVGEFVLRWKITP